MVYFSWHRDNVGILEKQVPLKTIQGTVCSSANYIAHMKSPEMAYNYMALFYLTCTMQTGILVLEETNKLQIGQPIWPVVSTLDETADNTESVQSARSLSTFTSCT